MVEPDYALFPYSLWGKGQTLFPEHID